MRLPIIPYPNSVTISDGIWTLTEDASIGHDPSLPASSDLALMAAEQLRPVTGFPLPISATPPSHGIYFLHRPDLTAASEYSLDSDLAVIRIGASSRTGLFYGLQTLLQLLPPSILLSTPSDRHHMPHGLNPRLASLPMARSDA